MLTSTRFGAGTLFTLPAAKEHVQNRVRDQRGKDEGYDL